MTLTSRAVSSVLLHGEPGPINARNLEGVVRVFVAAVGGQGSLLATTVIGEACVAAGLDVVTSEVHGMAQRGGIVESAVIVGGERSPIIADGSAHVLLGFEPVEAARALAKCNKKTVALVSTTPIVPFTVSMGKEKYPAPEVLDRRIRDGVGTLICLDAEALAKHAGTSRVLSAGMVGGLAGLGLLQVSREHWLESLLARSPARWRSANEKAFDFGWNAGCRSTTSGNAFPPVSKAY